MPAVKSIMIPKLIRIVLSIIFLVWFFYYLIRNIDSFVSILDISIFNIIIIGSGIILTFVVNNIQTIILLREEGSNIGFWESLLLSTAAILANHIPFRLGTIFRMHYLKKVHGVRYARSSSLFSIWLVTIMCMTGFLGFIGITVGYVGYDKPINMTLMLLFVLLVFISLLLFIVPKPKSLGYNNNFTKVLNDFFIGFESVRKNHILVFKIMVLNLIRFIIMAGRFYFTFQTIQVSLPVWILFLIAPTTTLATIVSILPAGNLGLREGIIGYLATVSGQEFKTGFFAGTVDRAILFAITFLLGTMGLFYCLKKMKKIHKRKLN